MTDADKLKKLTNELEEINSLFEDFDIRVIGVTFILFLIIYNITTRE